MTFQIHCPASLISVLTMVLQGFIQLSVARGQEAARYAIVDIGDIGGRGTYAWGINNAGDVIASTIDAQTNDLRTVIWSAGVVRFLDPLLPGMDAKPFDINDAGQVVGKSYVALGVEHPVLWLADGTAIDLGTLGGEDSIAYGINDSSQVVGASDLPDQGSHGVLWSDGKMIDLGDLGRPSGGANAINNMGQIVGISGILPSSARAFVWQNGEMTNLGTLPNGSRSDARDINDSGLIAGVAHASNGVDYAVIWEDHVIRSIHNPSIGVQSAANGINSLGQIVGFLDVDRVSEHTSAFYWEPGGSMVDVMTLLPPNHAWRQVLGMNDINDVGEMACYGDLIGGSNGAYRGVLITPVHSALTLQGPQPGRAGTLNGLRVTGCTPGARVSFYYSTHGGGTLVPGCNHTDGVTLQLDDPIQIGSAVANQNGIATLTRFVPTGARNLGDVLIQAVQQNGCKISQLVVKRFE